MRLVSTAMAIGLLSMAGHAFTASVTVHSNGVSGNYATIGQALAAVQAESAGPNNPDVITILNEGPFREALLVIQGDTHANSITIRGAEGVRPILVSTSTGSNALEIRKNGSAEVRDLIIIPAANISQTATRAILYEAPPSDSTGYDYHLENILISSNSGKDRPVSAPDGLGNPLFSALLHKSFRGDGGIRGSSTDTSNVYRMTMRRVVVSCVRSSAPFGVRSFQDGASGSELVIGEGCVFSRLISTTTEGAAINLGGMEGAPNIGRIQGTEESPVLVVNNSVPGLYYTGITEESHLVSDAILANNTRDALFVVNPLLSVSLANVTVARNNSHAIRLTQNNGSALNYAGTLSVTDSIIAGNGASVFSNSIYATLGSTGSLLFEDSAIVLLGLQRLTSTLPNGMSISGTGTVVRTRVISADPRFASLSTLSPDFAVVTAAEFEAAGAGGEPLRGGGRFGALSPPQHFNWFHFN